MQDVFQRIAKWNRLHFKQEYNGAEVHGLLLEEYKEWMESQDEVNDAKELLDIIHVALGGVWKLNYDGTEAQDHATENIKALLQNNIVMPGCLIGALLDDNSTREVDQMVLMHCIVILALAQLNLYGFEMVHSVEALNILCDSNATKSKGGLKPAKGEFFRYAEPALEKLMERIKCNVH